VKISKGEAVSKLAFAENHHYPIPKGSADFQRFPPFREGKEGGENHKVNLLRQPRLSEMAYIMC
jgi:hypothetical protein